MGRKRVIKIDIIIFITRLIVMSLGSSGYPIPTPNTQKSPLLHTSAIRADSVQNSRALWAVVDCDRRVEQVGQDVVGDDVLWRTEVFDLTVFHSTDVV